MTLLFVLFASPGNFGAQAKVIAKFSEPLCAVYRQKMGVSVSDWETTSIVWDRFSEFAHSIKITPDLISPFELQVFFQDNVDLSDREHPEALPPHQLAECVIQCIRHHSSDWADASKTLDGVLQH